MNIDRPVKKTESPIKSENIKVEPENDQKFEPDLQKPPQPLNGQTVKKEENLNRLTSAAQNMLPTGLTLTENHVETPIPSLLRGNLRDYQHIGLDWLVSLDSQDKGLISGFPSHFHDQKISVRIRDLGDFLPLFRT